MRDREETIEVRDIYKTILSFKNQNALLWFIMMTINKEGENTF